MSFSGEVKDELSRQISRARHCQLAEIAAIIHFAGKVSQSGGERVIHVYTENVTLSRKYFTLVKKAFQVRAEISIRKNNYLKKNRVYTLTIRGDQQTKRILDALKMPLPKTGEVLEHGTVDGLLIHNSCCRRAYIRGAFLSAGSISDPEKSYHYEIVAGTIPQAQQIMELIRDFDIDAKIVERKGHYVVYVKEGEQIVDLLNVMEAHHALMELENVRILKDVRNTVNRKVNCETANINKTVNAAVRQIEDIELIKEKIGFDELTPGLRDIAMLRLEYPDLALKELGEKLNPPVGKSGVNHRLRKLMSMAEDWRKKL